MRRKIMASFAEYLNPEELFSRANPLLKAAEAGHRMVFESIDTAARLQLAFVADLLDLNRDRFDSLYKGQSLQDALEAHRDLAIEVGKRAARHVGELSEVFAFTALDLTEAANEQSAIKARPKKAKAS